MNEPVCPDCGGPIEVSNCAFEGCLKCWGKYLAEMEAEGREDTMTEDRLREIIAEYLKDRDDIADASIAYDEASTFIGVETQGGNRYLITVEEVVAE